MILNKPMKSINGDTVIPVLYENGLYLCVDNITKKSRYYKHTELIEIKEERPKRVVNVFASKTSSEIKKEEVIKETQDDIKIGVSSKPVVEEPKIVAPVKPIEKPKVVEAPKTETKKNTETQVIKKKTQDPIDDLYADLGL